MMLNCFHRNDRRFQQWSKSVGGSSLGEHTTLNLDGSIDEMVESRLVSMVGTGIMSLRTSDGWKVRLCSLAIFLGLGLLYATPVFAQGSREQGGSSYGPAVIAMHTNPSRLADSNFIRSLGILDTATPVNRILFRANRMRGVIALSDNIENFIDNFDAPEESDFPAPFQIEFQFPNERIMEELRTELAADGWALRDHVEGGHVTYVYPDDPNLFMIIADERTAVLTTGQIPYIKGQYPKMTEATKEALQTTLNQPAGLVIDFLGSKSLVNSGLAFSQDNLPPSVSANFEAIKHVECITTVLKVVPKAEVIALVDCVDSEGAKFVSETLEGIIAIAKSNAGGGMQLPLAGFLAKTKIELTGTQVRVQLTLSENLVAGIRWANEQSQAMNEVKQASLAVLNYEGVNGRLPFSAAPGESNQLSWRVRVLPFLNEEALAQRFNLSEPWDSPQNKALLALMPEAFGTGRETSLRWIESDVKNFASITDGTSNTIAFVYSASPVPWTQNKPLSAEEAVELFEALKPNETIVVGFYDGAVSRLDRSTPVEDFRAMLTPAGGEIVNRDF